MKSPECPICTRSALLVFLLLLATHSPRTPLLFAQPLESGTGWTAQVEVAPGGAARLVGDPCLINNIDFCNLNTGNFIGLSDRSISTVFPRIADDFTADATDTITNICWYPCFFNPTQGVECSDPGKTPPDDFRVRFYEDDFGFPGQEIGPLGGQPITILGSEHLAPGRCWLYNGSLPVPVAVTETECYWIEITGYGGGPNGCRVYWSHSEDGNLYSMFDNNGDGEYGQDDIVLDIAGDTGVDLAFCLDMGMLAPGCGTLSGACCTQGGGSCMCSDAVDHTNCQGLGGRFYPNQICAEIDCIDPVNDDCSNATNITAGGQPCEDPECSIPFDTLCATTDGLDPECGVEFGSDVWFEYHTGSEAVIDLTISACESGSYDGVMAIYSDGTDICPCPGSAGTEVACNDDECGPGGMPSLSFPVQSDTCYLIRVGGFEGEQGTGTLEITLNKPEVYVDADATGAGDGTSWEDAYPSLQDALADPVITGGSISTIFVAEGFYYPDDGVGQTPGDRAATFQLLDGVEIYGGFAGTESSLDQRNISANVTVLSGDLLRDEPLVPSTCCEPQPTAGCDNAACEAAVCAVSPICCQIKSWDFTCSDLAATECPDLCAGDNTDNSFHVVTGSGNDATALLDGFTITAGNANDGAPNDVGGGMYLSGGSPTVANCTIAWNTSSQGGAGMYCENVSSPTVSSCVFNGNEGGSGGGMFLAPFSSPTVSNSIFTGNSGFAGGGMWIGLSTPTITGCRFSFNSASFGGGIAVSDVVAARSGQERGTSAILSNCVFNDNSAPAGGGGGLYTIESDPLIVNCKFNRNMSVAGGGVDNSDGNPELVNCQFSGNISTGDGGGMHSSGGAPVLTHCTFSANTAQLHGGGMSNDNSNPTITNSVFWANVDDVAQLEGGPFMNERAQIATDLGTPVVNYSLVQGGWTGAGGTGIKSTNPLFADADGLDNLPGTVDDNYRLTTGSPAIDAGDEASIPADAADLDNDGNTSEDTPLDLANSPRLIDDLLTANTGAGVPPAVDMGAYEFFRDCNSNGIADSADIAMGTSLDLDTDGIPDECLQFDGDCDSDGDPDNDDDWSCPLNWDEDIVPDNSGTDRYAVTIDSENVDLDQSATIDSLSLLNGATLNVTCEDGDPDCVDAFSNLTIVGEAGLFLQGDLVNDIPSNLFVNHNRVITVLVNGIGPEGPVVIGPGGNYAAAPGASRGGITPVLGVGSVEVYGGTSSGTMSLNQSMTLDIEGDLLLSGDSPNEDFPEFFVTENASVNIGGSMYIIGYVNLQVSSSVPVALSASFVNHCLSPSTFQWESGALTIEGSPDTSPQLFEVAGVDFLFNSAGFVDNFAMGTLTIGSFANVVFEDDFDNNNDGQGACTEALYVDTLVLANGAQVTVNNCRVYYNTLIDNGATINFEGCGSLALFSPAATAQPHDTGLGSCTGNSDCPNESLCGNGVCYLPKGRYLSFAPGNGSNPVGFSILLPDGRLGWIGAPTLVDWQGVDPAWLSLVVDTPVIRNWDSEGVVYVGGCVIAPNETYELRTSPDGSVFTAPLVISTAVAPQAGSWADIVGSFDQGSQSWSPPNGFVNFNDIDAAVKKFQTVPSAPHVSVIDLHPQWPNYFVNFSDIDMVIKGFQETQYPVPVSDCQTIANCPLGPEAPCLP